MTKILLPHEKAGRLIRLIGWINLIGFAGICDAIALPAIATHAPPPASAYFGLLFVLLPLASLVLGAAVKAHKNWARGVGIVFGCAILLAFPLGTIAGVYILIYLTRGWHLQAALSQQRQ